MLAGRKTCPGVLSAVDARSEAFFENHSRVDLNPVEAALDIKAFASDDAPLTESDFIGKWMRQIAPAAEAIGAPRDNWNEYLHKLEFASVELSLKNLMTFPFVAAAVGRGELQLHGAYFGVASGRLLVRDPATGDFEPVAD